MIIIYVHTPKIGFYIVNFILLFLNKRQKDPTFGYYNLAHSDVTVSHSFQPKIWKDFYELQRVMLHQPERSMVVFSKILNSFLGEAAQHGRPL